MAGLGLTVLIYQQNIKFLITHVVKYKKQSKLSYAIKLLIQPLLLFIKIIIAAILSFQNHALVIFFNYCKQVKSATAYDRNF
jgi:hypothetical protein